jgi:hypothetical protein
MGGQHTVILSYGFILENDNVQRVFRAIEKTRKKEGKPPVFSCDHSEVLFNELLEKYFALDSTKFSASFDHDEYSDEETVKVTIYYTNGIGSIERWGECCELVFRRGIAFFFGQC